MRLLSVNVGKPETFEWDGREYTTAIFKSPVDGPVAVGTLGIEGDNQVDRSVHGGPQKAVYCFPSEHYDFWRGQLGIDDLKPGALGENFTTEGLLESELAIGDRLKVGALELRITEPRQPCRTLAARYRRPDLPKVFFRSPGSGFYCSVVSEGQVTAGDPVEITHREPVRLTVEDTLTLIAGDEDRETLEKALAAPALPDRLRERFARSSDEAE